MFSVLKLQHFSLNVPGGKTLSFFLNSSFLNSLLYINNINIPCKIEEKKERKKRCIFFLKQTVTANKKQP